MKENKVFYPFLFAIYPLLYVFAHHNISIIYNNFYFLLSLLVLSIANVTLWLILNKLINNNSKAGLILLFIIIIFNLGSPNLTWYIALSIFFGIAILLGFLGYRILKTNKNLDQITKTLNLISLILIIFPIFNLIINEFNESKIYSFKQDLSKSSANFEINKVINNKKRDNLPDIYYIIPDEYAGYDSLKSNLNFDNKDFYNYLKNKGFYIPPKPSSNYPMTFLSIPSSLNMDYFDNSLRNKYALPNMKSFLSKNYLNVNIDYTIFNNNLRKILKLNNYKFIHILNPVSSEALNDQNYNDSDILINCSYTNLWNYVLYKVTLLRFLDLENKPWKKGVMCSFSNLKSVSKQESKEPRFIYAHILCPHEPYIFDRNGKIPKHKIPEIKKDLYLDQLIFTNKLIEKAIENILTNSKRKPIIVIQSDHGARFNFSFHRYDPNYYNNFIAIYLPDKNAKNVFYDTLTPVNIFRIISNEYFGTKIKRIEDRKERWLFSK